MPQKFASDIDVCQPPVLIVSPVEVAMLFYSKHSKRYRLSLGQSPDPEDAFECAQLIIRALLACDIVKNTAETLDESEVHAHLHYG